MKECKCKDWKENMRILDSAIMLSYSHGFGSLKRPFTHCPWCGHNLEEVKEK